MMVALQSGRGAAQPPGHPCGAPLPPPPPRAHQSGSGIILMRGVQYFSQLKPLGSMFVVRRAKFSIIFCDGAAACGGGMGAQAGGGASRRYTCSRLWHESAWVMA